MPGSKRDLVALQLEVIGQLPPGKYDYYDLAGWQTLYKMEDGRVIITKDGDAGTTVAPTEVLWSADVEVTDFGGAFGAITSDSFSNVAGSGDLGVVRIWYSVGARRLDLKLSEAARDAGELTLHLDDVALASPQGSSGKSSIRWRRTRLSWKNGQTVAVRLTRASQTQAATSAELRSLAVSGATLSPAFDPAVLVYAAEVDRGASNVTVSAGASDSAATVAIEPSEDADAESPDHQVAVPFGETLITVSVTAADEATRREYRVVANRPAPPVNVSFGAAAYTATEGGTPAAVTVLLSADPERAITVPLTATPAAGADGQDYSVPNSVSFASGDALSRTITVTAADDEVEEDGESVVLGFGILPPGVTAGETQEATVALSDGASSEQVNAPPTGLPTIAGTARVGETLTASETGIDDANGLAGVAFAWQWVSNDGTADTDIGGATEAAYTLAAADAGRSIKVRVTFTDDGGTEETLTSAATGTIRNTEGTARPDLTASFEGLPTSHDGERAFRVRVAFSDGISISYTRMRDASFTVTAGAVTGARRVDGRRDLWEITIEPDSDEAVTVRLPETTDCAASGAICTGDGRGLSQALSATIAGPADAQEEEQEPLTATFSGVPGEHTGKRFMFGLTFSEDVAGLSYKTLRDAAFSVTNGKVTRARRRTQGSNEGWTITVAPDSNAAVTIRLPAGAVETSDGRSLESAVSATVKGPAGISVANARVDENTNAALDFAVTLDRAASGTVTVDYATSNGTAMAGADYTTASGTLTFNAGERSKTVSVAVLDDDHDEGEETVTLTLSNASGARITDGTATGTIKNLDPLPRALLARFGRTAAVHVVEHVEARIAAPREPGVEGRFAGRALRPGMAREIALNVLSQLGASVGGNPVGAGVHDPRAGAPTAGAVALGTPGHAGGVGRLTVPGPMDAMTGSDRGLTGRGLLDRGLGGGDVLTGSAFALTRETRGGILSFWSRGARSHFVGQEGALSLGGDVRTTMVGADYARGPVVAGLSLSHSRGLGEYAGVTGGQVASSVTGLYPWLGYQATDRITVWGVVGYGAGGRQPQLDNTLQEPRGGSVVPYG